MTSHLEGDKAYERMNQEAVDEENEKHRQWRVLVLGQFVAEIGHEVDGGNI